MSKINLFSISTYTPLPIKIRINVSHAAIKDECWTQPGRYNFHRKLIICQNVNHPKTHKYKFHSLTSRLSYTIIYKLSK